MIAMNRTVELPEHVYAALREAAEASGMTPAGWIAAHLPDRSVLAEDGAQVQGFARTLADEFAGRTGVIGSGGQERLSEHTGERFADHLEDKRRAGHL
ncbi:MAG: hypothetical protein ACR2H9_13825 [Longimicrobiaceae bacterium]